MAARVNSGCYQYQRHLHTFRRAIQNLFITLGHASASTQIVIKSSFVGNPLLCRAFAFRHSSVYASARIIKTMNFTAGVRQWKRKSVYWLRQYGKSHSRRSDCQRSGLPGQIWVYTPSPDKVAALHDSSASTPQNRRKKWRKSPTSFCCR